MSRGGSDERRHRAFANALPLRAVIAVVWTKRDFVIGLDLRDRKRAVVVADYSVLLECGHVVRGTDRGRTRVRCWQCRAMS